jgi:hypothetical protein
VNRHAKASSAGSVSAGGLERDLSAFLAHIFAFALVFTVALAGQASASQVFEFKEAFGGAAAPTFEEPTGLAVDQSSGDLLVMDRGNGTISRFKADGTPDNFSALGTNVIDGAGGEDKAPQEGLSFPLATEAQIAIDNSGTITDGDIYVTASPKLIDIFASSGAYLGQLTASASAPFFEACGVTVDSSGDVYVGSYEGSQGVVQKFSPSANPPQNSDFVTSFATPARACTLAAGAGPTAGSLFTAGFEGPLSKQDAITGNVDYAISGNPTTTETVIPDNGHVLAAQAKEVVEYNAASASQPAKLSRFALGSTVEGIAADSSGNAYVSRKEASELEVWALVPVPTVTTSAPTSITPSAASLNGTVNAEGVAVSGCKFEYGLTTNAGFEKEAPCSPPAADIPPDLSAHSVSAAVTGLQPNATYKFRLTAANANGTASSEAVTFTTTGPPQITEIRALNATQSAANVEGKIDPSGFGTSYRFEWGPTTSYGNQVPAEFEPYVGSGKEPVRVSAKLNGLAAGQAYHYRIVASSSAGTTATPDQTVETLNSCGLPDGRCFELVSRREAGPVAIPGETLSPAELHFQAATTPGALAYVVEAGYPEASKGAEVLYRGTRAPSGWESTQISNPFVAPNEQKGIGNGSGNTKFLSDDLSCGFAESPQPLTDDPSTRLAIEYGGTNLYRVNLDNSYTAVSNLAPENAEDTRDGRNNYEVAYASQDCAKVLFSSIYHYPGIAGKDSTAVPFRLYEWDEGTLRNVGVVPGPGGEEVVVEAHAGTGTNSLNTVSEDGSRIFFSAKRQASSNPEEIGKEAVFVREDGGATVRDLSLSQTIIPDKEANYQWATPDGSHLFFTANAGLTEESSPEGTDLYEYNLETEELIDRSASQVEGGAQVAGFVGAAEDGSRVYFISRAQLLPGRGKTLAENQSANTYSVYGESGGGFSFVGVIREKEFSNAVLQGGDKRAWSSRVSPDGRYLLFVSSANVTGYESGGSGEAYLYDADGGSQSTTCISCRQDGQPSVGPEGYEVLSKGEAINDPTHPVHSLVMREGEPQVFFSSPDPLAPGAVEGQNNVFEWAHGQVFRLSSPPKGQRNNLISGYGNAFVGASNDASDVYLFTPETLNWEDGDERMSVYDARVGGGFPEPPAPPTPCEATSEGSCQGPAQGAPALGGAASAAFNGPGNPPEQPNKKKSKKKPHKKKHKHAKKKSKDKTQARQANGNRRAGK